MKTSVLSGSDMIYANSLQHLAAKDLAYLLAGKQAPFWGKSVLLLWNLRA